MQITTNQVGDTHQVRTVINHLVTTGTMIADFDGSAHTIFPVAASPTDSEALRRWVMQEKAAQTIEIGLGYGMSALHICEGLVANGRAAAHHVVIDPFQASRFANCGLQVLQAAAVLPLVEHHAEKSHFVLPRLLSEGRQFDFAYVDGNHRFDGVFLDLYYLGHLVKNGGVIMLDDYDLPGIKRAVAFFTSNLNWTIAETANDWIALRTATGADDRHFTYFVEF
ncbi:MAG: class I SAM-dependent methyltransferase [Caldilinea sp. CFX5]|nr:class I SAM-dependent methyltransferase [Caldilinea sp. CFX5]